MPEITTALPFAFQGLVGFLKDIAATRRDPLLRARHCVTLFSPCALLQLECISSGMACRECCVAVRVTAATKPRGILHFFVLTEALPRLTARKAATIEPTIQAPISAVTALNDNAPNNSTILSSIRTTSISRLGKLASRIGAQIAAEPAY